MVIQYISKMFKVRLHVYVQNKKTCVAAARATTNNGVCSSHPNPPSVYLQRTSRLLKIHLRRVFVRILYCLDDKPSCIVLSRFREQLCYYILMLHLIAFVKETPTKINTVQIPLNGTCGYLNNCRSGWLGAGLWYPVLKV